MTLPGSLNELSPKLRRFSEHNSEYAIVESAWLDKNGKDPNGGPDTWVQQRTEFEDGTMMILSDAEVTELSNAGFKPRWKGFAV